MKRLLCFFLLFGLTGCAGPKVKTDETYKSIQAELGQAVEHNRQGDQPPPGLASQLLPPLKVEMPKGRALEPRFDLVMVDAPARQVFLAIVSGTRYSMLLPPDIGGNISVNLKDVTVPDALEAIRELYGYEYTIDGSRIFIKPLELQTRVYKVNYLMGQRDGTSSLSVSSSSLAAYSTGQTGTSATTASATPGNTTQGGANASRTQVNTRTDSDFWKEIESAVKSIVGTQEGRKVVMSPQSGVIVVRAYPTELRQVAEFLRASQLAVERQVIIEAKILEVQLSEGYQAGINWAAFRSDPNSRASIGLLGANTGLAPSGTLGNSNSIISGLPGATLATASGAGIFGLAFQTGSFAALLSFLESQGDVHVLSSPRIATLNNQKAVLKVGTEEYFVTNAGTVTTATTAATSTSPSVTLRPFFSGIVLDVTPQIDERGGITLHVHPAVTRVKESLKTVNMGTSGTVAIPTASQSVSETDSIVRAMDGQIVAIGGLMKLISNDDRSGIPGASQVPGIGGLFRQTNKSNTKSELVILLKPTVVRDGSEWGEDILDAQRRVQRMGRTTAGSGE